MLFDNLPLPLPWYKEVQLQDRFRQNVAVDSIITQLAPKDGVLPFQIRKASTSLLPTSWVIKSVACDKTIDDYIGGYSDTTVVDMSSVIPFVLVGTTLDGDDFIIFKNERNSYNFIAPTFADGLPPGVYYMAMTFGSDVYVSETFRVPFNRFSWDIPDTDCNYPALKWYNDSDLKPIHYTGAVEPFYNLLYLDTFITASEPTYEAIGDNDGLNEFHPAFQKMVIKYRLSSFVPDYIKVAMYLMLMHDKKYLFTEKGLREGDIKNPEITATLSEDGAFSTVELLFEQISIVSKTSCPDDMEEPEPPVVVSSPTLTSGYCNAGGVVDLHTTTAIPAGYYGELWADLSGVYTKVYPYIGPAALAAGTSVHITGSLGAAHFKIVFRTFTADHVFESTISTPSLTC